MWSTSIPSRTYRSPFCPASRLRRSPILPIASGCCRAKGGNCGAVGRMAAIGENLLKIPPFPTFTAHAGVPTRNSFCSKTPTGVSGARFIWSRADGGHPQLLLPPDPPAFWPDSSQDGKTIVFDLKREVGENSSSRGLYLFNFEQRRSAMIPGSEGLSRGRWSPDGRFLAGVSEDQSAIKLLDLKTHRWTEIARGAAISFPVWSPDSVLYFQDILAPGEPVYRFQISAPGPATRLQFRRYLAGWRHALRILGFRPGWFLARPG